MINIKPLSVNQAWQGKRFKTDKYKYFEIELLYKLPKIELPKPPFKVEIIVYYTNNLSDIDNFIKPFLDVLQKKYGFNDKEIYKLNIEKVISKLQGFEFEITTYEATYKNLP